MYLKDIAGYEEVKEEAKKIIEVLKNHKKYEELGAYIPKGLILSGNPGVGKTMLAKAIANESGVQLFEFESNECETESKTIKSLKEVFKKARDNAPSIVFIDELDELVSTMEFASDYSRKVVKILLSQIDGITSTEGVMVIATTNHKGSLPEALLRSGRMDKQITIDMPDNNSREEIFKLYLSRVDNLENVNPKVLASKTKGFSGADIKTLINETIIQCASNNKNTIVIEDFEKNIPVIMFQDIRKENKNGPEDVVCYHEIGHFITELRTSGKITSISAERFGLIKGYAMIETDEIDDIGTISKNTLENKLIVSLGGMAAEEVLFGDITNGSSSDIATARGYIKSLASTGAFGFDLLSNYVEGGGITRTKTPISQDRIKKYEDFETKILTNAYESAKSIIIKNKELCMLVFNELKQNEKLSAKEVKEIIINSKNK